MNKLLRSVLFSFSILAASVDVQAQCAHTVNLGPDTVVCDTVLLLDAGNPGMMYSWNTSQTSQQISISANGTYIVTVTDSAGCPVSDTIDVVLYAPSAVGTISQLGGNALVCGNTSGLTLYSTGHSGYVMWFALDTVSGVWGAIGAGDTLTFGPIPNIPGDTFFFMTVVLSGSCPEDTSNTVAVPYSPSPEPELGPDIVSCGGMPVLDAGYPGEQYLWNTGDTTQTLPVTVSGNYHITVINSSGCTGEDSIDVTIATPPVVTFQLTTDTICITDAPMILNATPAGGTYSGPGTSSNIFDPSVAGAGAFTLEYVYADSNGCSDSATVAVTVEPCVGITETVAGAIHLFPNPAAEYITVQLSPFEYSVEILDMQGRTVDVVYNSNGEYELTLFIGDLADGVYLARIVSHQGVWYSRFTKGGHN
jgi:hypothetical protein